MGQVEQVGQVGQVVEQGWRCGGSEWGKWSKWVKWGKWGKWVKQGKRGKWVKQSERQAEEVIPLASTCCHSFGVCLERAVEQGGQVGQVRQVTAIAPMQASMWSHSLPCGPTRSHLLSFVCGLPRTSDIAGCMWGEGGGEQVRPVEQVGQVGQAERVEASGSTCTK